MSNNLPTPTPHTLCFLCWSKLGTNQQLLQSGPKPKLETEAVQNMGKSCVTPLIQFFG